MDSYWYRDLGVVDIYEKTLRGERLSAEDGRRLFECPDPVAVGRLAHAARTRINQDKAYYVLNQHVNYTNVCVNGCTFCAFQREEGQAGGYVLSKDDVLAKVGANPIQPREIHIVGGCHPTLRLDYFTDLLSGIKAALPDVTLKCFTAVEIAHFARLENMSTVEVLQTLKDSGLSMMPGGGAEIFAPHVRERICPRKSTAEEWLRIHGEAHQLGLKTNCTMLFGHYESAADRVDHLLRLREQQDATGGFVCFIPLPFLTENSQLKVERGLTGVEELKTIAVSRLLLDNIPHIKAYWVMLTLKQAQAALYWGADDFDGTVVEEHIGHEAGATSEQGLTRSELVEMISGCGFRAVERNSLFEPVEELPPAAPPTPSITIPQRGRDERITPEQALDLYNNASLFDLAQAAHAVRLEKHPDPDVTYVVDRNINYSNVCVCCCKFCAFFKRPGEEGEYVLTREELGQKIQETLDLGGTQILMQGGHHPDLPLSFYEEMLAWIKGNYDIHVHAFSPPEIVFFSEKEGISVDETLRRLIAAGLDSIPGGGAEILVDRVRTAVSPNKCGAAAWLDVMRKAHKQGLRTTATMMFGHEETPEERIAHLFAIRELQDETGGFTAFIPWTFQPDYTALTARKLTSVEYLRLLALSRLVLDNVPNLQVSWVTMGPKIAQLALYFGGNDFGSTMIEENVVKAAGVAFRLGAEEIHDLVRVAGFSPKQRRMDYTLLDSGAAND